MSHNIKVNAELKDRDALIAACQREEIRMEEGTHQLFSGSEKGLGVWLPGWRYPAVVKEDGSVVFDNYNGRWGDMEQMNRLKAIYGVEFAKCKARMQGYSVTETFNEQTNKIELRIQC